jgi:hypothetical protein
MANDMIKINMIADSLGTENDMDMMQEEEDF